MQDYRSLPSTNAHPLNGASRDKVLSENRDREKQKERDRRQAKAQEAMEDEFHLGKNYTCLRVLGHGAYGVVGSFTEEDSGNKLAIKKIKKIFTNMLLARRTLRELKLLRHLGSHQNIIKMKGILLPENRSKFEEIYVLQELMEADLHQIIQSGQSLTDAHFQFFLYQMLKGVYYIHSCNIIHRDLKPGNLLVNSNCELRICDFGLSRGFLEPNEHKDMLMSEYVATRWYRAPEIMLSHSNYDQSIDIWSVGCIFAELLGGKVLFPGKQLVDQMNLILNVLGSPSESFILRLKSRRSQAYLRSQEKKQKVPFKNLFPNANPLAIDLLEKMLKFDPCERISVANALRHPYLGSHFKPQDLVVGSRFVDFEFEKCDSLEEIRVHIWDEIRRYHPEAEANPAGEHPPSSKSFLNHSISEREDKQENPDDAINECQSNRLSRMKIKEL